MPLSLAQHVTVAPDVLFRIVGDEAVLLNLKTETYLGLDPVGTRMWTVFGESKSLKEAFDVLLSEFDVEPGRLLADLENLVGQLQAEGLIELTSEQSV